MKFFFHNTNYLCADSCVIVYDDLTVPQNIVRMTYNICFKQLSGANVIYIHIFIISMNLR